jgi:glycosyl transferase family 1
VKVNVLCIDDDASADYRLVWPAAALVADGADVEVHRLGTSAATVRDADVLVFNRPIRQAQADVVEELVDEGRRVVIDMDDDFDHLPLTHAMYGIDTSHLHRACKVASAVTTSTPALTSLYGYGHGITAPNYVPDDYLHVQPAAEHAHPGEVWCGWYGSLGAHSTDLQVTGGGVGKALVTTPGAQLVFTGHKQQLPEVKQRLRYKGIARATGFMTLEMLPETLVNYDVGLVPLADITFNISKSHLKGLEFASCGVPFVASPTPEYRRLGLGVLARFPNDWYRATKRLLQDSDHRAEVAAAGRERASQLTIEGNCQQYWDAWTGVTHAS